MNDDTSEGGVSYAALQEHVTSAYAAFVAIYTQMNPPPVAQKVRAENRLPIAALAAMVVASVVVSGSRTVGEFQRLAGGSAAALIVGLAAFVMLELGIVAYAYLRTRYNPDPARAAAVRGLMSGGMWLAFGVAVAANIHSTVSLPDWVDTAVTIVLGFSAPVLAFISGDVLGMLAVAGQQRQQTADAAYEQAISAWRAELNRKWTMQRGNWGAQVKVSALERPRLPRSTVQGVQPVQLNDLNAERAPRATTDKQQVLIEWLNAHPEHLNDTITQVHDAAKADGLTVSRGTLYTAFKRVQAERTNRPPLND